MYKNQKISLQELILRFLRSESATTTDQVISAVERDLASESKDRSVKPRYIIMRTIKQLGNAGMLELYQTERSTFTRITSEGRQKLRTFKLTQNNTLVSPFWDGKWRIILLDFSEERKDERDAVRYLLKRANFACLKNSVWISPYPMEHLLVQIKDDLELGDELVIIVSESIDQQIEQKYMREFGLMG